MRRFRVLACLAVIAGFLLAGCATLGPAPIVGARATVSSGPQAVVSPQASAALATRAPTTAVPPTDPNHPGDGPSSAEQQQRQSSAGLLVASVVVLAAMVAVLLAIH